MRPTITTTEKKAVRLAKQELAAQCDRIRLRKASLLIRHCSVKCVCGETSAVRIWTTDFQKESIVGYCKSCGERN
jgi:hypothetical protein